MSVERAAVTPLLAASGTLAAAALAAIVLSGQPDSSADLLADRDQEPRPTVPESSRGGPPTDDDIARVVQGISPGTGLGSSLGLSVRDVLFRQSTGAGRSALAPLGDDSRVGAAPSAGGGGSSGVAVVGTGTQTSSSPAAPVGSGPVEGPTGPAAGGSAPAGDSGGGEDGVPAPAPVLEPVLDPVVSPAQPVTDPVLGPVLQPVVEPVLAPVVEPVVGAVEPVLAPVVEPVVGAVEPAAPAVERAVEPVLEVVPDVEPVTDELPGPADIPTGEAAETSLVVELPG